MSRRTEIIEARRTDPMLASIPAGMSMGMPYGADGGLDAGSGGDQPVNIFKQIHALLRGKYLFAVPLALVLGLAGAVAGWSHRKPVYFSTGMIRINSSVSNITGEFLTDKDLPMYRDFLQLQAMRLRQGMTISEALDSPEWQLTGHGSDAAEQAAFRRMLTVGPNPRVGFLIDVTYMDADRAVAKVGVDCLIKAYMKLYGNDAAIDDPATVSTLQRELDQKSVRLQQLSDMIRKVTVERYGEADLAVTSKRITDEQNKIEDKLAELKRELAMRLNAGAGSTHKDLSPQEIAVQDDRMQTMLTQRQAAEADLQRFRDRGLGEGHPDVVAKKSELAQLDTRIETYSRMWNRRSGAPTTGAPGSVSSMTDDQLAIAATNHERLLAEKKAEAVEVATHAYDVEQWKREMAELRPKISSLDQRLSQIRIMREGNKSGRISIEAPGGSAEIKDTRPKWAAAGFVGGAGLPMAIFLLWGLIDQRRFRYSDEAGQVGVGANLLGILPNLPRNLADPEEAAAAAHCVHRIRSILQIAGPAKRVYAVTSSTAGDGKTSLTLSLGLSYAASGSRTLLVDFDMIGGGLTSSLNAKTDRGLAEVLSTGELNGHIVATKTEGLWLLPIGRNDQKFASRLSAPMVRQFLESLRDQYDVVLVDTGPILGSLEAAFVTSSADGVILVVGRGQHRHYVDKAMGQIRAVGGNLLGLVFNRATAFDFKKSVTSASIRSVGVYPTGGEGGAVPPTRRLGPIARTVVLDVGDESEEPAPDDENPKRGRGRPRKGS